MSDVAIGPDDAATGKKQEIDALAANERDMDEGLAGAEAKPFAPDDQHEKAPPRAMKEGTPESLVSARRNAGRE